MSITDWPLLDPIQEDALHLDRLLSVDERPFQRISKRLVTKDALIRKFPTQLPSPPPDGKDDEVAVQASQQTSGVSQEDHAKYRDEVLLDFAGLEATLIRIQFLKDANERERERYATEKNKILSTAEAVRVNTAELHLQLAEAQRSLALKKQYDELADTIFKDKALKPRDVLDGENEKLRAEIEELEQEGRDFGGLWRERRERFDRVVEEGKSLTRYIKGEKDEPEEDEEDGEEDGEEGERKGDSSNVGTPRPEMGGLTPLHYTDTEGEDGALAAHQTLAQRALGSSLRVPGVGLSRNASPAPSMPDPDNKDTEMREASDLGSLVVQQPVEPSAPEASADTAGVSESMDTT